MKFTTRINTIPAAAATVGTLILLGVLYTLVQGFDASPVVGYTWTVAFAVCTLIAILGRRLPSWARGVSIGAAYYTGMQTAAYWLTTPTPPTTGEYVMGAVQGVALLGAAVLAKRYFNAGVHAAELDMDAHDANNDSSP